MIVVTGGAGFIGSNLVAGLDERGERDIVICDSLGSSDKWRNISKRELRDIVRPDRIFDYLNNHAGDVRAVFHLGAISSTTEKDADLIVENNFSLSRDLWRWCARSGARFIYASSGSTYGNGEVGFVDEESPEALAKLRPLNPYGWSKHLFDRRIARVVADKTEHVPPQWVGLKFFNVYGPNEYHKGDQMSVACKLYPQVAAGAAARLFKSHDKSHKDGGQLRDFVYVGDCVDVMLWMLDHPEVSGLFNVGTGKARTFEDLARAVFTAMKIAPKISFVDMPDALRGRYQYFTQADMTKLRSVGYDKPFTELEEGIRRYVQDFMACRDSYR